MSRFNLNGNLLLKFGQDIHFEMEDLLEQANEIQESLGRSYAVPDELDEADLEAGTRLDFHNKRCHLNIT